MAEPGPARSPERAPFSSGDRFIVAGNGPSLAQTDLSRIDLGDTIIRVTNFFFEPKYYLGRRVDLLQLGGDRWIFPFYAKTLRRVMENGAYEVRSWSCHQRHVIARARRKLPVPYVPLTYRDEETRAFVEGLIRKYGKTPTTGVYALINAHGLGAKTITIVGIDFYESPRRYVYDVGRHAADLLKSVPDGQYNERFHSRELDRRIVEYLARRGDVRIYRTTESSSLSFLELAPKRSSVPAEEMAVTEKEFQIHDWEQWSGPYPIAAMKIFRHAWGCRRRLLKIRP